MNFLDLVLIIIIIAFAIIGVIKGFISELFGKGTPVLSLWMAILLYKKLFIFVHQGIDSERWALIVSFVAIFVLCFLILKIIEKILQNVFDSEVLGSLDHVLGLAFGFIEGVAVAALILIILAGQPWFDVSSILETSRIYEILYGLIKFPIEHFDEIKIPEAIKAGGEK